MNNFLYAFCFDYSLAWFVLVNIVFHFFSRLFFKFKCLFSYCLVFLLHSNYLSEWIFLMQSLKCTFSFNNSRSVLSLAICGGTEIGKLNWFLYHTTIYILILVILALENTKLTEEKKELIITGVFVLKWTKNPL